MKYYFNLCKINFPSCASFIVFVVYNLGMSTVAHFYRAWVMNESEK